MNSFLAQSGGLFYPERASTLAWQIDRLYLTLVGVLTFFTILIFTMILRFMIRYRRRRADEWPPPIHGNLKLELTWTLIPLAIGMGLFAWGANLYFAAAQTPPGASDIYVVGRQWMWKIQHPSGRREINELHVPLGQPIRLTLTSEDVIHSFFVPAFRMKRDTVPGRYTEAWFEATQLGEYHLFCAEYCGTKHSLMIGRVIVMEPAEYQRWLSAGNTVAADSGIGYRVSGDGTAEQSYVGANGNPQSAIRNPQSADSVLSPQSRVLSPRTMADAGARLFDRLGCRTCHQAQSTSRGPALAGRFGDTVRLADGTRARFDKHYVRDAILKPTKQIVSGYQPIMPAYEGQISEEELFQIVEYLKSSAMTLAADAGAAGTRFPSRPYRDSDPADSDERRSPQPREGIPDTEGARRDSRASGSRTSLAADAGARP